MDFHFTIFQACTLIVMAVSITIAVCRFQARLDSNWPLAGYAALVAYTFSFKYSLSPYWVCAGLALALVLRIWKRRAVRWAELPVLIYVVWRGLELLVGW